MFLPHLYLRFIRFQATLKRELQTVYDLFEDKGRLLLPYNPSLEVCGIDIKVSAKDCETRKYCK